MKKCFVSLCLILQTTVVFAQRPVVKKRPAPVVQTSSYEISGGVNPTSFDYREELPAPYKSNEKGIFYVPFLRGRIFVPSLGESFVNLEVEYSGNVLSDFDGTTQDGDPVKGTNAHAFFRAESDFYWEVANHFFLYTGLGYRYWNRFLNGGTGYREIYTWVYLPFGIFYDHPFSDQFSAGVDVSIRTMLTGNLEVIFSETIENGDDTDLKLGNRTGYKLLFPLKFQPSQSQLFCSLSPWYEYSEIGASPWEYNRTRNSEIQEPASKTVQYGLELALGWQF